jgi:TRAP-type C4-dicarboxylate transport system substrate-binding protein
MLTGGQPIQDYAPAYFFFNGPYVIRDFAHFQKLWNGPIGRKLATELESRGKLVGFDPVYRGYRQFTSNKPLVKPEDARDLKLRLPPTPDWISVWSSLGAQPVQVPLPGIYGALKEGSAEASEGDLTQIQSLRLNEVQSHLTLTNHLVGFGMTMANACFFRQELDRAQQQAVQEAMHAAANWGSQQIIQKEGEILAALEKGGMTIVRPDADAIRKAAEPAVNALFASKWTVSSWPQVLAY